MTLLWESWAFSSLHLFLDLLFQNPICENFIVRVKMNIQCVGEFVRVCVYVLKCGCSNLSGGRLLCSESPFRLISNFITTNVFCTVISWKEVNIHYSIEFQMLKHRKMQNHSNKCLFMLCKILMDNFWLFQVFLQMRVESSVGVRLQWSILLMTSKYFKNCSQNKTDLLN